MFFVALFSFKMLVKFAWLTLLEVKSSVPRVVSKGQPQCQPPLPCQPANALTYCWNNECTTPSPASVLGFLTINKAAN